MKLLNITNFRRRIIPTTTTSSSFNNHIFLILFLTLSLIVSTGYSKYLNNKKDSKDHRTYSALQVLEQNFNLELYEHDEEIRGSKSQSSVEELRKLRQMQFDNFNEKTSTSQRSIRSIEQDSTGSDAYTWDGQTCPETTFGEYNNNSKCPMDCYSHWGQGVCNQQLGVCNCSYFYTGDDCSINNDPDHNWDYTDCHGGRYCPPVYNAGTRSCICPPGYAGLECTVCTNDDACKSEPLEGGEGCDPTVYITTHKSYSCAVTSAEVNGDLNNSTASASIDCYFPGENYTESQGYCTMDLFYRITGAPLYFNCTFEYCDRTILPHQIQKVACLNSTCNCTTYCGWFLAGVIANVHSTAEFLCEEDGNCTFSQNEISVLLPTIPLSCISGACNQPQPIIYPVPIQNFRFLNIYIGAGGGLVGATVLLGLIFIILIKQDDRRKLVEDDHIPCELRFENITCVVKQRKRFWKKEFEYKTILNNVNGICIPGQLTAIMGLSGSGKTSLLDILSGRKNVGDITGNVLVNGNTVGRNFKRLSGYVTQEDIMIGTLTCREHLMYAAMLKLPEYMPYFKKEQRVKQVLAELGLSDVADNRIGTPEKRGISGGERRRLSIAAELIVDPSILFLDEPTSGLDSHSASELITLLRQLARNRNRTIIFSIHQPSAEIFEQFDNLVLLHKGNPYYSGKSADSVQYFINQRRMGVSPNSNQELSEADEQTYKMREKNPADFLISVLSDKNSVIKYQENPYQWNYEAYPPSHRVEDNYKIQKVEEYATSFWTQFFVVCRRSLLNYLRNPFLLRTTYFVHISVGLILGYLFWKLPANLEPGCQNRFGSLFFIIALLSFGSITSLDLFYNDRIIFIRERANGYYRTSSYFLAKVISDIIPMRVLPPIMLGSICYYMIGLRPGILHFIYFLISLVLTSTTASSMCMAISTISPTFGTANMISILLLFIFLLFDGFLLARQSVPNYLIWLVWLSFMSYGLEIPVVNEFKGLWIFYNPPNTRGSYADGLEFLTTIGANPDRLFTDMYALGGMICGYLLLAYLFLRFLVREYR
eukprot:gene8411-10328_t